MLAKCNHPTPPELAGGERREYFKAQGCKQALYLDGFVSRAFMPSENLEQLDGQFGIIIGALEN